MPRKAGQILQFETFILKYKIGLYLIIIFLSLVNLILAGQFLMQIFQSDLVKKSQASSRLPTIKLVTPQPFSKVSGQVPIVLEFEDGSHEGFASLTVLVDGLIQNQITAAGPAEVSFTIDSKKFLNGPHKVTLKATDTQDRSQTMEVNLSFANSKKKV